MIYFTLDNSSIFCKSFIFFHLRWGSWDVSIKPFLLFWMQEAVHEMAIKPPIHHFYLCFMCIDCGTQYSKYWYASHFLFSYTKQSQYLKKIKKMYSVRQSVCKQWFIYTDATFLPQISNENSLNLPF